jgi:hypothetical protein
VLVLLTPRGSLRDTAALSACGRPLGSRPMHVGPVRGHVPAVPEPRAQLRDRPGDLLVLVLARRNLALKLCDRRLTVCDDVGAVGPALLRMCSAQRAGVLSLASRLREVCDKRCDRAGSAAPRRLSVLKHRLRPQRLAALSPVG